MINSRFGLLFNAEKETNQLYIASRLKYENIRDTIKSRIISRPRVMLGLPYNDKWFISPGNSYINTLIEDAGGEYIWRNYSSNESMPLSIESVFREALNSDFWLNIGNVGTKEELLAIDSRFKNLPPVYNGQLYNNIKRKNTRGGNDYWESGAISPQLVLEDIASILHPELIDNHKLKYYLKVD